MTRSFFVLLLLSSCSNETQINSATGAAACVTAAACKLLDFGASACTAGALDVNNPVFAAAAHISAKTVNCIAAAGANCDNARKCLNGGEAPSVCSLSQSPSCSGSVLTSCSDNLRPSPSPLPFGGTTKFDCGDVAQMCVAANGSADCGVGTCAGAASMCVGTKIQVCQNGILKQFDCADFGSNCVVGALNIAHCRGTGAACQTQGFNPLGNALRCDGTVLVRCADSQEARFDCAATNQQCVADVDGENFGCAQGSSCTPGTFSATCNGVVLNFCNDGVISTFDCGQAGFKSCSPGIGGGCVP
jgi:hypothetical protein